MPKGAQRGTHHYRPGGGNHGPIRSNTSPTRGADEDPLQTTRARLRDPRGRPEPEAVQRRVGPLRQGGAPEADDARRPRWPRSWPPRRSRASPSASRARQSTAPARRASSTSRASGPARSARRRARRPGSSARARAGLSGKRSLELGDDRPGVHVLVVQRVALAGVLEAGAGVETLRAGVPDGDRGAQGSRASLRRPGGDGLDERRGRSRAARLGGDRHRVEVRQRRGRRRR